jgi:hypothetical protein
MEEMYAPFCRREGGLTSGSHIKEMDGRGVGHSECRDVLKMTIRNQTTKLMS